MKEINDVVYINDEYIKLLESNPKEFKDSVFLVYSYSKYSKQFFVQSPDFEILKKGIIKRAMIKRVKNHTNNTYSRGGFAKYRTTIVSEIQTIQFLKDNLKTEFTIIDIEEIYSTPKYICIGLCEVEDRYESFILISYYEKGVMDLSEMREDKINKIF